MLTRPERFTPSVVERGGGQFLFAREILP